MPSLECNYENGLEVTLQQGQISKTFYFCSPFEQQSHHLKTEFFSFVNFWELILTNSEVYLVAAFSEHAALSIQKDYKCKRMRSFLMDNIFITNA